MEEQNNSFESFENIQVTQETQANFLEAAKWGKFLSIVGFVGIGLMALSGLSLMVGLNSISAQIGGALPAGFGFIGIIYIIAAVISFFPTYYFYNFSVKMKSAIQSKNNGDFDLSIENLKSMYKFSGILTIVILSIYGLMFLFGIIAVLGR